MRLWKKNMAGFLAVTMIASTALVGCGSESDKKDVAQEIPTETESTAKTWSEDTSPVDLTMYLDASFCDMDIWGTDTASQIVTEETGVNLVIEKASANDSQKINLLIASNDLPDIIIMEKNNPAWEQMILNDQLYAINELMDLYAPGMKDNLDPTILENNKYEDGNVYRVPNFIETPTFVEEATKNNGIVGTNQTAVLMRQDYYEEIGKPSIETPEQFTEALQEIQKLHPDKIPFYIGDGSALNGPGPMNILFGIAPYYVENDEVKLNIRDPKYYDMLMWMNDLVSKNLLTKESFVDDAQMAIGKVKQGLPATYVWTLSESGKIPQDNPNTTYEALAPWDTYKQVRTGTGWYAVGITKNAKRPDRAIRFLEYTNSEAGHEALCYGVEGDTYSGDVKAGPHYKMVDGKPTYHKAYIDDKAKDWAGVEKQTGLGPHQMLVFDKTYVDLPTWTSEDEKMVKMNELYGPKVEYQPALDINIPGGTEEFIIKTKIDDLIKEHMVKIVFAQTPELAKQAFDTFIKTCEDAGAAKLEAYLTEAYK